MLMATLPARLVSESDVTEPRQYDLSQAPCVIGRATECDVVVSMTKISRAHAQIEFIEGVYFISDAGSTNGTFVNGHRISGAHPLQHRDEIGLSDPRMIFTFYAADHTELSLPRIRFDDRRFAFFFANQEVELSADQFDLLRFLYTHQGELCTREDCSMAVWKRAYDATMDAEALDQIVSRVRARLKKIDPGAGDLIVTVRGRGYRLDVW